MLREIDRNSAIGIELLMVYLAIKQGMVAEDLTVGKKVVKNKQHYSSSMIALITLYSDKNFSFIFEEFLGELSNDLIGTMRNENDPSLCEEINDFIIKVNEYKTENNNAQMDAITSYMNSNFVPIIGGFQLSGVYKTGTANIGQRMEQRAINKRNYEILASIVEEEASMRLTDKQVRRLPKNWKHLMELYRTFYYGDIKAISLKSEMPEKSYEFIMESIVRYNDRRSLKSLKLAKVTNTNVFDNHLERLLIHKQLIDKTKKEK